MDQRLVSVLCEDGDSSVSTHNRNARWCSESIANPWLYQHERTVFLSRTRLCPLP